MSASSTRHTVEVARARVAIRLLALLAVALWSAFYALPMPARLVLLPGLLTHLSVAARASRLAPGAPARDAGRIQRLALVFAAGAAGLAIVFASLMLGLGGGGGSPDSTRHALFATLAILVTVVELWLAHAAKRMTSLSR